MKPLQKQHQQRELILTLIDFSGSMYEEDYVPSRREGAIEANRQFINVKAQQYPDDLIGIIAFDESAYLLKSVTSAGKGCKSLCDSLDKDIPGIGGTDFMTALRMAKKYLFPGRACGGQAGRFLRTFFLEPEEPAISGSLIRRTILLTDGGHNGNGDPVKKLAEKLKAEGVMIECVGIAGDREDVDEALLKEIASKDENGRPRHRFIGDTAKLIQEYRSMANQIKPV